MSISIAKSWEMSIHINLLSIKFSRTRVIDGSSNQLLWNKYWFTNSVWNCFAKARIPVSIVAYPIMSNRVMCEIITHSKKWFFVQHQKNIINEGRLFSMENVMVFPTRLLTMAPFTIMDKTHETTYSLPNFYRAAVEIWEWISDFNPYFTIMVITHPYCG